MDSGLGRPLEVISRHPLDGQIGSLGVVLGTLDWEVLETFWGPISAGWGEFEVKLDRCVGSCNTINDLSNKVCVPNKIEDLDLSVFNMITGINESKTLTKDISCECKSKFDGKKCNSDQWWNNKKCRCECKKRHVCEKDYIWNPATCRCKNGKYLVSIMNDSAITCAEIIEPYHKERKSILTYFNKNKATCETQIFYILLAFLLVAIALLIAVNMYSYLIKYRAKQIFFYHFTTQITNYEKFYINKYIIKMESNDELKEIDIKICTCYHFDDITKIEDLIF